MPEIPAFCDRCGTAFGSGIVLENCRGISMSGNKSGPCPSCGGMGSVPNGLYDVTDSAVRVITNSLKTKDSLVALSAILIDAQKQNLSREQVNKNIEKELPELNSLASLLPKTRNELYAFIGLILMALTYLATRGNGEVSEADVQKIVDDSIAQSIQSTANTPSPKQVLTNKQQKNTSSSNNRLQKKQQRNAPCACGSGKKYKKCCYLTPR